MKYGETYRIIELDEYILRKIDNTISNLDLQIKKSLVNDDISGRDPNIRISKQAWIKELSFCKYFFDIGQKLNEVCKWNFNIQGVEPIQYGIYSDGGKYDWHVDQGSKILFKGGSVRKISMTLNLTDPKQYEGGNLKFDLGPHAKGDRYKICDDSRLVPVTKYCVLKKHFSKFGS